MAGDKDKKGFSGLLDLASEVSDVHGLIRSEPKEEPIKDIGIHRPIVSEPNEEAIEDGDVKKNSRKATTSTENSIDPTRVQPAQDRGVQRDRGETERTETFKAFALLFGFLIGIGLIYSISTSGNNVKSDPVLTSRKIESDPRKSVDDTGSILMDFPINTSPDATSLYKDLPQKSVNSQNSQGGPVLPDAKATLIPKENESKALTESGRTETSMLFSGNEREVRLACVDFGAVVLSDGKRYSITGLSSSDFSHLMSNYDARSIGFELPLRLIDQERIWSDTSGVYSRKAKLFAKSGYVIILFSKKNVYHHVEYSELSGRDRQYIDAIEFSRPLKDDPFNASNDPFNNYHVPDIKAPFDYEIIPPLYDPLAHDFAPASNNLFNDFYTPLSGDPFE